MSATATWPPRPDGESDAGVHTNDAICMVSAMRWLEQAVATGYGGSYAATTLQAFASDTRLGYQRELRRYAACIRKQPGAGARESLDDHTLHLVQTTSSDSSIKKLISGVRILEKLRWVPPTVCAGDWLVVQSIEKFQQKIGKIPAKTWVLRRGLSATCRMATSPAEWELCPMSALSISFGLRAVEALSVAYDGEKVTFMGAKGRLGTHSESPGPWAREWGEPLRMLRAQHGYPPGRSAWFTSRAALHKGFKELAEKPGLECKLLRWHSWRRYASAQLCLLGAPTGSLLRWGGWVSPSMLKIYAYSWQFVRGGPLPVAAIDERSAVSFSERPGTTLQLWALWLRADIALALAGQEAPQRSPRASVLVAPGTKQKRTRSQPEAAA